MRRKDREIKERAGILDILRRADCCHVALMDGDRPYLVTMNHAYVPGETDESWGALYFHSARAGRKIEVIRANPRVCFSCDIDHQLVTAPVNCDWGMRYASVVGEGRFAFVEEPEERTLGLSAIMAHYDRLNGGSGGREWTFAPQNVKAVTVLRLDIEGLTGKRKA